MDLNLVSWNVNGLRAVMKKGFRESVEWLNSDILCLQEIKANNSQVDVDLKSLGYEYEFINSAQKPGYSGTAIFSKIEPLNVFFGIGDEKYDGEGRVITAEFDGFYLVNVYTPNSQRQLERLDYREEWEDAFLKYLLSLKEKKPSIVCGDLNVAHKEIDVKNDKGNKTTKTKPGSAGFTDRERSCFERVLESGFIDTFRYFYPDVEKFSWWTYMFNSRAKNVGWRIDYFLVSNDLEKNLEDASIYNEIYGSDHCPVGLKIRV